jgi:putative phosphoesterase
MRVALISDIHANLDALRAVLADLPPVDRIACCGDLVEYYDQPNEVCALVRERGIACIRGNHDAYVTGALEPDQKKRPFFRTDWTRQVLADTHLRWLESLGTDLSFESDGRRLRIRHASPWDEETYLRAESADLLARVTIGCDETLVVGHTHRPMHLPIDQGWLLNPGSVGQPRDWDPRASYAVLDMASGGVEPRRVAYDVVAMQRRLAAQGWDPNIMGLLSRTREETGETQG